jgi:hypothetical protein
LVNAALLPLILNVGGAGLLPPILIIGFGPNPPVFIVLWLVLVVLEVEVRIIGCGYLPTTQHECLALPFPLATGLV